MRTYDLLHPYHVVPSAELMSAFMECAHFGISHMFMEMLTVSGKGLILFYGISYACIQVDDPHILQAPFQFLIKSPPVFLSMGVFIQIYGNLCRS